MIEGCIKLIFSNRSEKGRTELKLWPVYLRYVPEEIFKIMRLPLRISFAVTALIAVLYEECSYRTIADFDVRSPIGRNRRWVIDRPICICLFVSNPGDLQDPAMSYAEDAKGFAAPNIIDRIGSERIAKLCVDHVDSELETGRSTSAKRSKRRKRERGNEGKGCR